MLEWINSNGIAINAVGTALTVLIWAAYLQLFYCIFRSQRRSMIVISRVFGSGPQSRCLVSNMGAAPVYVLSVLAVLEENGSRRICTITDYEDIAEGADAGRHTRQGPLLSGRYIDVGAFETMVRCAGTAERTVTGNDCASAVHRIGAVEIIVIALHGSSRRFVGACRRFQATKAGGDLSPTTLETKQLSGFGDRRSMKRLLREEL